MIEDQSQDLRSMPKIACQISCHTAPKSFDAPAKLFASVIPFGVACACAARLTNTTTVGEEVPGTMVTVALRVLRFLLIRLLAGLVWMSETTYPERAFSVIVNVPALTLMFELHLPTETLFDLVPNVNLKEPLTPVPLA